MTNAARHRDAPAHGRRPHGYPLSKAIQVRMGHSTICVTLGRYGPPLPRLDEAIAVTSDQGWTEAHALPPASPKASVLASESRDDDVEPEGTHRRPPTVCRDELICRSSDGGGDDECVRKSQLSVLSA